MNQSEPFARQGTAQLDAGGAAAASAGRLSFAGDYLGTILRPRRTFEALLADDRRVRFGLIALATNMVLYTLVFVFLTIR